MHGDTLGTRPSGEMDDDFNYTARQNIRTLQKTSSQRLDTIDPLKHNDFNHPISIQTSNGSGRTTFSNFDPICGPPTSSDVPVDSLKPSLPVDALIEHYTSYEIVITSPKTEDDNEISELMCEIDAMENNTNRDDVSSPCSISSLGDDGILSDLQSTDSDTFTGRSVCPNNEQEPQIHNNISLDKTYTDHEMESEFKEAFGDVCSDLNTLEEDVDSTVISPQPLKEIENIMNIMSKTEKISEETLNKMYSMTLKTELRYKIECKQVSSSNLDDTEEDNTRILDPNQVIEERKARNRKHARHSREKRKNTLYKLQKDRRQLEDSNNQIKKEIEDLESIIKLLNTSKNHVCNIGAAKTYVDRDMMEATGTVDTCQETQVDDRESVIAANMLEILHGCNDDVRYYDDVRSTKDSDDIQYSSDTLHINVPTYEKAGYLTDDKVTIVTEETGCIEMQPQIVLDNSESKQIKIKTRNDVPGDNSMNDKDSNNNPNNTNHCNNILTDCYRPRYEANIGLSFLESIDNFLEINFVHGSRTIPSPWEVKSYLPILPCC